MKGISRMSGVVFGIAPLISMLAMAQPSPPISRVVTVTLKDGPTLKFEIRLQPSNAAMLAVSGGVLLDGAAQVHRFIADQGQKVFAGYDLLVEPVAGRKYRVTFQPLGTDPASLGFPEWRKA